MSEVLNTDTLLHAYKTGFFPMADEDNGEIWWHSPDPRAIIPLEKVKIPRSVKKAKKKYNYEIKINCNFEAVVIACSNRDTTWINEDIVEAYSLLNKSGWAYSVETYFEGELVGGLYGVVIGGAFFGESMFSNKDAASKVAFFYLIEHLKNKGFILLDSQYINEHTKFLGAIEIPKIMYLKILEYAIMLPCRFI